VGAEAVIELVVIGVRFLVAGAFLLSLVVAFTFSAVRKGHLRPFGAWANLVRRWSEPLLRPLERRLVRAGASPADAPAWLAGVTLVGGLVVVGLVNWLIGFGLSVYDAMQAGALLAVAARSLFEVLKLAIMVRVLASWFALSPYSKFMRLTNGLTDWIVDPIRRIVPNIGMFDFSPLIAYFVLSFAERMVIQGLFM
jgi:YggT family protein